MSCGTASSARASTSAFMTMPGPPPAGVSSTVRCLSVACARMSIVSSDQMPDASALPARLAPAGRETFREDRQYAGAPHDSRRRSRFDFRRRHDHDLLLPRRSIFGTVVSVNGSIKVSPPAGRRDFDNVACAEIMQRVHGADLRAVRRYARQGRSGRHDKKYRLPRSSAAARAEYTIRYCAASLPRRDRRRRRCARRSDPSPARSASISKHRVPSSRLQRAVVGDRQRDLR